MSEPVAPDLLLIAGVLSHFAGACVAAMAAALLLRRRDKLGRPGAAVIASLVIAAVWSAAVAANGPASSSAAVLEVLRNLAFLFLLYRLFASDGRHASVAPVRPVLLALALAALLELVLVVAAALSPTTSTAGLLFHSDLLLRLLVTVGGLVLVHNLYVGAMPQARPVLRWPTLAIGLVWGFELNLYTIAYLASEWPQAMIAARGLIVAGFAAAIGFGAGRGRHVQGFRPSRAVTFQSFALLAIGAYLVGMVAVAQWLSWAAGDFAQLLQFIFLIAASAAAIVLLPSPRLRGWLSVVLSKHFFQHRYDYRAEWLRFTATVGRQGEYGRPLEERAVQAIADITESPAGLLLVPTETGELELAARWQWPTADVPAVALDADGAAFLERNGFIVDLDDVRAGIDRTGEAAIIPQWLRDEPRAWALVPLLHFERLVGVVVLVPPPLARKLDWEDFDLLRVAGRQLASYLAEHNGQAALAEAGRFDDFNRRIAFVMHDIKNLASQLGLLARNAERHAENPAFRADMLTTLRNSADRLNGLIARLSRYGAGAVEQIGEVRADDVAGRVAAQFAGRHDVILARREDCRVAANAESLEQVLLHLVSNAAEASPRDRPVFLAVTADGAHGLIKVIDSGSGMSPDFVRTRLFKPFDSTKPSGFGIGAYEARELVRAMNGRLEVESREGMGTRFLIRLPLFAASAIDTHQPQTSRKIA